MPSPDAQGDVPVLHVERTDDAAVLQWVCTSPSIAAAPAGRREPSGALAALLVSGQLTDVWLAGTVVRCRAADVASWRELAPVVQAAIAAALAERASWLFAPSAAELGAGVDVSVADVQRVIDTAAGAVAGAHGGALTAVSVTDGRVLLAAGGACHGCSSVDQTLERLVRPALQRAYPELVVELTG